jgi:hypothetical protein
MKTCLVFICLLAGWTTLLAKDEMPCLQKTQNAIELALVKLNWIRGGQPSGKFMPLAFGRYLELQGWSEIEYTGPYPNAFVDPHFEDQVLHDFLYGKELHDLQPSLPDMVRKKIIDAYFIIYYADGEVHLDVMDSDRIEKKFVAPDRHSSPLPLRFRDFQRVDVFQP